MNPIAATYSVVVGAGARSATLKASLSAKYAQAIDYDIGNGQYCSLVATLTTPIPAQPIRIEWDSSLDVWLKAIIYDSNGGQFPSWFGWMPQLKTFNMMRSCVIIDPTKTPANGGSSRETGTALTTGNITKIEIAIVRTNFIAPAPGTLSITLATIDAGDATYQPGSKWKSFAEPELGVQVKGNATQALLSRIAANGVKRARIEVPWVNSETSAGVYNWAPWQGSQSLPSRCRAVGLRPLFTALWTPAFYDASTSAGQWAYAKFCRLASENLGPGDWEFWNEPDNAKFSPGTTATFAKLSSVGARAVIGGGLRIAGNPSYDNFPYVQAAIAAGVKGNHDLIGFHGYRSNSIPETYPGAVRTFQQMLGGLDSNKISNTEWGWSSFGTTEDAQADLFIRSHLAVGVAGLPWWIWYDLIDDGSNDSEGHYGLFLNDSATPKKAWTAWLFHRAQVIDYAAELSLDTPPGLHLIRYTSGSVVRYLSWSTSGTYQLAVDGRCETRDGIIPSDSTGVSISPSTGLVYITPLNKL